MRPKSKQCPGANKKRRKPRGLRLWTLDAVSIIFASKQSLGFRPCCELFLAFVDDFVLEAPRNGRVPSQFHRKGSLALGHASQVRRITEGIRQGDFGGDVRDAVSCIGVVDQTTAGDNVADDRTLVVLRAFDIALHDWFEQHWIRSSQGLAEAIACSDVKRAFARVDIVVATVLKFDLDTHDWEFCQWAFEHGVLEALFDRGNELLRDPTSGDMVFEFEGFFTFAVQRRELTDDMGELTRTTGLLFVLVVELDALGCS